MNLRNAKLLIFAAVMFLLTVPGAFALNLSQAKGSGQLGETPSGYLEVVTPPGSAEVQALMREINAKRRAKYQKIAKKNGTSLAAVEQLAGKKAMDKTSAGQYIKVPGKGWVKVR